MQMAYGEQSRMGPPAHASTPKQPITSEALLRVADSERQQSERHRREDDTTDTDSDSEEPQSAKPTPALPTGIDIHARQVTFGHLSDEATEATDTKRKERSRPTYRSPPRVPTRTRSASAGSTDRITIPAELLLRTLASSGTKAISDTAVAPKPFTGKSTQDPEVWLEYLERYCDFRQLAEVDRLKLFGILLHEGAADWFSTLPVVHKSTYGALARAFKNNYYKSPELKWKEAGALWNQAQAADERVEDFVTRLRKAARRLELPAEVLHYAVINGLRGPIRLHVVQQGVKTLDDTIRAAKVAEAAASTTPDALTVLMLDAMKANAQASEKQATELKQLATRVAALTGTQAAVEATAGVDAMNRGSGNGPRRALLPTPQNRQRQDYAQRAATRTEPGPRSFERPGQQPRQQPQQQQQMATCTRCGLAHRAGNCRADGQECRHCGRVGHYARVCRSGRATRD